MRNVRIAGPEPIASRLFRHLDRVELPVVEAFASTMRAPRRSVVIWGLNRAADGWAYAVLAFFILIADGAGAWLMFGRSVVALCAGFALYIIVKPALARTRPMHTPGWSVSAKVPLDRHSFPSGHFMTAVIVAIQVVGFNSGLCSIIIAILGCVAVGASSLCLGHHYPTDLIAGAALAVLSIKLSAMIVT
jgi:undecaprenyl-diphosphatase